MRVAGLGFRRSATVKALADALARAEALGGTAEALAAPVEKVGAEVLTVLAEQRGLSVRAVEVAGVGTPTQSTRIAERFGTGSVAEAAALAGAGTNAVLTVTRQVSADRTATAAMAEGSAQ